MNTESQVAKINGKFVIISAIIAGTCTIISSIISNNAGKEDVVDEVVTQITDSIDINSIDELITKYNQLSTDNVNLKNENEALKTEISQYISLEEKYNTLIVENTSLKRELEQLNNELQKSNYNTSDQENEVTNELESSTYSSKKVSIFDLEAFKGNPSWFDHSYYTSNYIFIDTHDNEYLTAYVGHHRKYDKNNNYNTTYLLDNKYSTCEGEIVWSKCDKNSTEAAWIEFYSHDELIYTTDKINVDSSPFSFSFSVEGIEELTIVRNSTGSNNSWIIYPYLNLIE